MEALGRCGFSKLQEKAPDVKEAAYTVAFNVIFILYPGICKNLFLTFKCMDLDNGTSWLDADLSIDCASPEHLTMQVYAIVMIFIFPIGESEAERNAYPMRSSRATVTTPSSLRSCQE